ncbi:MAG: hypothetical protein WCS52_00675 [bacterium]
MKKTPSLKTKHFPDPRKLTGKKRAALIAKQDTDNAVDMKEALERKRATGGIEPYSRKPMNELKLPDIKQHATAWAWERYHNHRGNPKAAAAFMRTLRIDAADSDPKWQAWLDTARAAVMQLRLNPHITADSLGIGELVKEYEQVRKAETATVRMTEDGDEETAQQIRAVAPELGAARDAAENMAALLQSDAKHGKQATATRLKGGKSTGDKAKAEHQKIIEVYQQIKRDAGGTKTQIRQAVFDHFNVKTTKIKERFATKTETKVIRKKGFSLTTIRTATASL